MPFSETDASTSPRGDVIAATSRPSRSSTAARECVPLRPRGGTRVGASGCRRRVELTKRSAEPSGQTTMRALRGADDRRGRRRAGHRPQVVDAAVGEDAAQRQLAAPGQRLRRAARRDRHRRQPARRARSRCRCRGPCAAAREPDERGAAFPSKRPDDDRAARGLRERRGQRVLLGADRGSRGAAEGATACAGNAARPSTSRTTRDAGMAHVSPNAGHPRRFRRGPARSWQTAPGRAPARHFWEE